MKKSLVAVLMIAVLVFSLAACGGSSDDTAKDKVVYKVGTEPTVPPFDTTDDDQNIVGLDMDLIKAIGEDQGFDVQFENLSFDGLIPALKAGNIDIVAQRDTNCCSAVSHNVHDADGIELHDEHTHGYLPELFGILVDM